MFTTKLIAAPGGAGATTSYVELDLLAEIPISINKSIADIREPDKRMGAFSKTITLPGTKSNNKFFEYAFMVNVQSTNWNSTLKAPAVIYVDGIEVHRGHLQLTNIVKRFENNENFVEYSVVVYGDNTNIFTAISDKKLTELDFSVYNHTYDKATQVASWSFTPGSRYLYPIIDYGFKQNGNDDYYHVEHLRPALYARELLYNIFTTNGKTWTSTFLDSAFFKNLVNPYNGDNFNMSASVLATYEFYAGRLSTSSVQNIPLTYTANGWSTYFTNLTTAVTSSLAIVHKPDDDSTSPFNDAGGIYNTSTGIYTVNKSGWVNIKGLIKFEAKVNFPSGAVSAVGGFDVMYCLIKSTNGGSNWTVEASFNAQQNQVFGNIQPTASYQTGQIYIDWPSIEVTQTNQFAIVYFIDPYQFGGGSDMTFWTGAGGSGSQVTSPSASIDIRQISGQYLNITQKFKQYLQGNTVNLNDALPVNFKQRDFFTNFIKMFNLYIDVDKSNTNNYIIEPRDDFYAAGTTKDWTDKLAENEPFEIKPMGETKYKVYKYQYAKDTDYFNNDYQVNYLENYGTKTKTITNDFLKDTLTTEVSFSATPIVDNAQTTLIVPKIYKQDQASNISPMAHNLRILYYSGLKSGNWLHRERVGTSYADTFNTTYPQVGMTDDPVANTVSLEFGIPSHVYYYDPAFLYTDNNLWNKYYYRTVLENTDRDSKICTGYFYLTPQDIFSFDFRDRIFIKDTYYYVNSFEYNPVETSLTKVELIKVKGYAAYVPVSTSAANTDTNNETA